jgi:hypothetical protein
MIGGVGFHKNYLIVYQFCIVKLFKRTRCFEFFEGNPFGFKNILLFTYFNIKEYLNEFNKVIHTNIREYLLNTIIIPCTSFKK